MLCSMILCVYYESYPKNIQLYIISILHSIILVLPMHTVVCRLKVDFADRMRKNIITNLDTLTVRS